MKSIKSIALTVLVLASLAGSAFAKTVETNDKHIESTETVEVAQFCNRIFWRC